MAGRPVHGSCVEARNEGNSQGPEKEPYPHTQNKMVEGTTGLKRANDRVCQGVMILVAITSTLGAGGRREEVLSKPKLHQTEQGSESLIESCLCRENFVGEHANRRIGEPVQPPGTLDYATAESGGLADWFEIPNLGIEMEIGSIRPIPTLYGTCVKSRFAISRLYPTIRYWMLN